MERISSKPKAALNFRASSLPSCASQGGFSIGTAGFPGRPYRLQGRAGSGLGLSARKDRSGCGLRHHSALFRQRRLLPVSRYVTQKLGASVPIIPGLLPVLSRGQTKRFVALCGAALPEKFVSRLDELGDDDAAVTQFGIDTPRSSAKPCSPSASAACTTTRSTKRTRRCRSCKTSVWRGNRPRDLRKRHGGREEGPESDPLLGGVPPCIRRLPVTFTRNVFVDRPGAPS